MDKDKKKIDTTSKYIWITQLMQRYGKQTMVTLLVPNPNFGGKRKRGRAIEEC
jgi:hypothetical protein